jgi:hypothetical protein
LEVSGDSIGNGREKKTMIKEVDGTNVDGSFITFSWMAPSPAPRSGKITYTFTIKEVLLNQSPYDAILSNPAFYKIDKLSSTVYLFPFIARGFVSGRRYAWQVSAFLNGVKMTDSEVNEFFFSDESKTQLRQKTIAPIDLGNTKSDEFIPDELSATKPLTNQSAVLHYKPSIINKNDKEKYPLLFANSSDFASDFQLPNSRFLTDSLSLEGAPKKKSPFQFSGSMKLYGETANRQGTNSEIPANYGTAELMPTLSIYGVPLSAAILLTTQGNNNLQSISSFAIGLDPSALSESIQQKKDKALEKAKDKIEQQIKEQGEKYRTQLEKEAKEKIEQQVKEKGEQYRTEIEQKEKEILENKIIAKGEKYRAEIEKGVDANTVKNLPFALKFFSAFQALSFGKTFPEYSKHTLSGVAVKGANVEFNPGYLYIAGAASNNTEAIDNISYQRKLYAGRLGIGKKDKSHFILTAMHAVDEETSILVDSAHRTLTPKENWVLGVDQKFSFFKSKLQLESEGVLSMLTRDVRDADMISDAIPEQVNTITKPKVSSSADYMYGFKGTYDNSNTKIFSEMKLIGPGFITLGNPALRNDKLSHEAKIEQKFFKRKVSLGFGYKNIEDNLLNTKAATTTTTAYIYKLGLNFKKLPTLRIMVMPGTQTNDKRITSTDSSKVDNQTLLYNVSSSYSYKIGKIRAQTMALYSYNETKTLFGLYDYWSRTSQLTESFSFKIPFTLYTGLGLVETGGKTETKAVTFDVSPSYTIKEKVQLSGGVTIAYDKDNSQKTGYALNSTILLGKYFTLNLRGEQNNYTDTNLDVNNYNEFIFRTTLSARW